MPVIKSAKKKLRKDKKRTKLNSSVEERFKKALKKARKSPTEKNIQEAVKIVDKTAKKNIIHKNKAARIKSSLSKLLPKTKVTKSAKKAPVKKPASQRS